MGGLVFTPLHRTANFPYLISPLEALNAKGRLDRTEVSWWLDDFDLDSAGAAVQYKDVALVFINSDSGEGKPSVPSSALSGVRERGQPEFISLAPHRSKDYITVDGNEGDRNNLTAWHNGAFSIYGLIFLRAH